MFKFKEAVCLLAVSLFFSACESTQILKPILASKQAGAEQLNLISHVEYVLKLNGSISDQEYLVFLENNPDIITTVELISERFAEDYDTIYSSDKFDPEGIYLIPARNVEKKWLFFLAPISNISIDGRYTPMPGLVYSFDQHFAFEGVSPDRF